MDELLSEKEQIEQIRDWWKENGTYVIAGIVIGVGGIFGFNQWKSSQIETRMVASTLFEAIAEEVAENRLEPAEALAADMYAEYSTSIYADQARLAMARLYMDQGRDEDAADTLRKLLSQGADADMQLIGRLRLAKILLYQGRPAEVLPLLEAHTDTGFAARYFEAIGDAHVALGDYDRAEAAYLAALSDPRASQLIDTALVQMKISDLPETPLESAGASDAGDPTADVGVEPTAGEGVEDVEDVEDVEGAEENTDADTGGDEEPVE